MTIGIIVGPQILFMFSGDITMEDHKSIPAYLSQLNGIIRIVGGNHDTRQCCDAIRNMGITIMGCLEYKGFICTHIPIHPHELDGYYRGNIHGHIHNPDVDLGESYFNVVCERIGYTPMLLDEIEANLPGGKIKSHGFHERE